MHEEFTEDDQTAVHHQLKRKPRATRAVAHRCPCGLPDVVQTNPRMEDGTPFPTMYYLTCPRAASVIGTLEASGLMKEMTERLGQDDDLAQGYRAAHEQYLATRDAIEPLGHSTTAGGMPNRVKCLHVLVAHSLAEGPGVNPLGDEALQMLPDWWAKGPCVDVEAPVPAPKKGKRGGQCAECTGVQSGRDRLRHQHAAPADRRRRPGIGDPGAAGRARDAHGAPW